MDKKQRPSASITTVSRPEPPVNLPRPVALSYWSLKRGQDLGYARAGEPPEEPEEFVSDHTIRV